MNTRRVLFLTKYGRAGASSRYRAYAYLSYLRAHGWEPQVEPLLPDSYVSRLYATGSRNTPEIVMALARRMVALAQLPRRCYDAIVVQYELFPHIPFIVEKEFYRRFKDRVIVDYDDATFAMYEDSAVLRNKIARVMGSARVVVAGNRYLTGYARTYSSNVVTLPTVVELAQYQPRMSYEMKGRRPIVGWIGTPVTAKHLVAAAEAFQAAAKRVEFTLRCIGAPAGFAIPGVDVEVRAWSEATETAEISAFDVGVMPLTTNAFTAGKCGFKLIQYMACGVPAVAAALGANCDIVRDGYNGYLASGQPEFADKLCRLLGDDTLRATFGRAARDTVRQSYCTAVTAPRLSQLLEDVATGGGPIEIKS